MRFLALALDDDGTIAWDNVLGDQVRQAIATLLDRHLQTTEKSAGIDLYGGVMACLSLRRPFKKNHFSRRTRMYSEIIRWQPCLK